MPEEKKFDTFDSVSHSLARGVEIQLDKVFRPIGGVLPDPEHNAGKNWIFGGADDDWDVIEESGDWGKFRSPPEKQASKYSDPYWCVSISVAGDIEKHLNKMMAENPATRPLFDSLGLLHPDGYADISERFIAKGSGTIPGRGNSQYNVYEFVRKNGFVGEKDWPANAEMTEDQQYSDFTPEVIAKGLKVLEVIGFNYKDVKEDPDHRREGLKRSSECAVVGGAVIGNVSGALLYRANGTPSYDHQLQIFKQDRNVSIYNEVIPVIDRVEDSYEPFLKDYAGTYPFKFVKIIKLTLKKKLHMKYKISGRNSVFVLDPVEKKLVPYGSGKVYKTIEGTVDYQDIIEVANLEELKKIAPLADWIITSSDWDREEWEKSLS